MKKTFLAKRNALLSSAHVSWGTMALAFALLVLLVRLFAPNFFWHITAPAFRISDAIAARSHTFLNSFNNAAALAARNELLAQENVALTNKNQVLLRREASQATLGGKPANAIIAGVIARPPESPYDTLVLAEGSAAGVAFGQEAFGDGGVPLGFVSSVLPDFSRVTLFSTSNLATQGWVGNKNLPVTLLGGGGGSMRAVLSRSANVAVGDIVSVPGPGALPIATVVRVDRDPSSPLVTLQIQPSLNLFSVTWVELRDTGPAFARSLSWATSTPL